MKLIRELIVALSDGIVEDASEIAINGALNLLAW